MSGEFIMDWGRTARTGVAEAVICAHKSAPQIAAIAQAAQTENRRLLFTRLPPALFDTLPPETRAQLTHDPASHTATLGPPPSPQNSGIGIVCAGTSDLPVAREAQATLAFCGHTAPLIADVGVAGLWRLQERLPEITRFKIVIAVAGSSISMA